MYWSHLLKYEWSRKIDHTQDKTYSLDLGLKQTSIYLESLPQKGGFTKVIVIHNYDEIMNEPQKANYHLMTFAIPKVKSFKAFSELKSDYYFIDLRLFYLSENKKSGTSKVN